MQSPKNAAAPTPAEQLMQMSFAHANSRVLWTSVDLGVYEPLAQGPRTAHEVAQAVQASERGIRMLLDVLVSFGLLTKQAGRYEMTASTADLLLPSSSNYVGGIFEGGLMEKVWENLAEAIRSGKPASRVESQEVAEEFFPTLVRALHVMHGERARAMARVLGAGHSRKGVGVLDVGCGSAVWGIALAEADPQAHVTAQDFPRLLELTRHYVERHGVADRFDYLAGDVKEVDFGEARFDLAILGNIVHSEGEASSRDLLARLHRALRPAGQVVIVDMVPSDDRSGPPFPLIFALNMLLHTETGDAYTLAEYAAWLHEAGFSNVTTEDIGSHSPLVIGTKS